MNSYELTVISRPEEEQYKKVLDIVKEEIGNEKGKIEKQEDWGVKTLAYEIKKQAKGHYTFYNLSLSPESVQRLDNKFRIKNELLKYMFIKSQE